MASRTPLYDRHLAAEATFTEFAGWEMPVRYEGIRAEHEAVRSSVGLFDVCHMGRLEVAGSDARALVSALTTNDVDELDPGDAQYSLETDEDGVVVDDTVVYRLPADADADYLFVPNAGHVDEARSRWTAVRDERGLDATVRDVSDERGMLAVQGPDAPDVLADRTDASVADLPRFAARNAAVADVECFVSRTGYTGEDGFELLCPADDVERLWDDLADACRPCGLGARDTLRMEMGYLLSGQDFDPETNPRTPYEAGVGFAVDLDHDFVGRDALGRQREMGVEECFVGLVLEERGVPRHGYAVAADPDGERLIGELTSGTLSPTLDEPIGLGYVDVAYADAGTTVHVVVRGDAKRARITETPFV